MAKFINSDESISSSLLLWSNPKSTQTAIKGTYVMKEWPVTTLSSEGPINFNLAPQPKGMMTDIHVVTKFKISKPKAETVSIVNNFANALWRYVDVKIDDRIDITQSMKNAYAYSTFFNHALNSKSDREDDLFVNELFKMDVGTVKKDIGEDDVISWDETNDVAKLTTEKILYEELEKLMYKAEETDEKLFNWTVTSLEKKIKLLNSGVLFNNAAGVRSAKVNDSQTNTLNAKFQIPLFNTGKCLPTNMKIRVSLVKNSDEFLILSKDRAGASVQIEDVHLEVTYHQPRDEILHLINERLLKEPAPYTISRPEIIIKPIQKAGQIIRLTDIFHEKLPPYAFFCLQKSSDFEGQYTSNPFSFIPFKKFQFYVNGTPYFTDPLEVSSIADNGVYQDFGEFYRQLMQTIGRDLAGDCLINSSNFQLHFMVGMSFGADRNSTLDKHLNLQEHASTYLEIDMGSSENIPENMVLIVYSLYDRQIQIDGDRRIRIVE